jgi:hypothetical protein
MNQEPTEGAGRMTEMEQLRVTSIVAAPHLAGQMRKQNGDADLVLVDGDREVTTVRAGTRCLHLDGGVEVWDFEGEDAHVSWSSSGSNPTLVDARRTAAALELGAKVAETLAGWGQRA